MKTISHSRPERVVVGVDTHLDAHVAVGVDGLGRRLGELAIPTTTNGYMELASWAEGLGEVQAFGVEGTGCYGKGLTRYLNAEGFRVIEVTRPARQLRRAKGKSDSIDAESAARAVLSGEADATPKSGDGLVECIRVLRVARVTAIKSRTQAINALRALVLAAPEPLSSRLNGLSQVELIKRSARLRRDVGDELVIVNKIAISSLARRCQGLSAEIADIDTKLDELVARVSPRLVEAYGVGTDTAGALLVAAGDNPGRIRSEAAFAKLCGAAPVPASSGKTNRHRLSRGGNREANAALYRIVLVRMRWHQETIDYVKRRTNEGKAKLEIIRCLKRYVAREVFAYIRYPEQLGVPIAA